MIVYVSDREFFSSNCCEIAVKCDWNGKNSQNIQNLVFLKKKVRFFRKKIEKFSETINVEFFVECDQMVLFPKNVFLHFC